MSDNSFDRQNQRVNERSTEESIQSNNFGGLNTIASPLNVPYQDSPLLLNTTVDVSGQVSKRKGSRVTYKTTGLSTGCSITGFTSGLAYNFSVAKRGTSILVFQTINNVSSLLMTKSGVFSNRAASIKPSIAATSEVNPRLIFATGVDRPVQLLFTEQQAVQTSTSTSIVVNEAQRFKNASTVNCLVYVNRVLVPSPTFSYNAGTGALTVSTLGSTVSGDVIDLVSITWQHWAEAQFWYGDRFFGSTTRFNSVPFDRVVKIPQALTTQNNGFDKYYAFALFSQSKTPSGAGTLSPVAQPQTATEWAFSDGSIYNYTANDFPNPSPFYVVMGALVAGGQPSTIYFVRRRALRFKNDTSIQAGNVDVYVNDVKRTIIYSTASPAYLVKNNYFLHVPGTSATSSTSPVNGLFFQAETLGVGANDKVEAVNNEVSFIGSSALGTRFDYNDGSYIPSYGLGNTADYLSGNFPSIVTFFQGRLVFGGFPHRPLAIIFSNVNDSVVPGSYYSSFSITDDLTDASSAFDIVLNSKADDRVVALVEWQSSLFVLTRQAVFRANGGSSILSLTNRVVSYVSSNGCVNSRCITRTDFSVLYVSDSGVYNINPLVENGEYTVKELSIKIRDKFGITREPQYEELPWLTYDSVNKQVLLGYPAVGQINTSRYIYVYNTYRESWTEYNTPCGFNVWASTEYIDRTLGSNVQSICYIDTSGGLPNDFYIIRWNDNRYLDFLQSKTHNGTTYSLTKQPSVIHTINSSQRRYGINHTRTRQQLSFTPNPITTIYDITVKINGVKQVQGVDFTKEELGYIYLLKPITTGDTLTITPSCDESTEQYFTVYVNNIKTVPSSVNYTNPDFTLSGSVNGDNVVWGNNYLCVYTTPQFLWNSLASYKRTQHAYIFLDNREGTEVYSASDANNSQDLGVLNDTYKTSINLNLSVLYNNQSDGTTTYDIVGYEHMYWDDGVFDVSSPHDQFQSFQSFKMPITGVGYVFQLIIWNNSDEYFKLGGYQIIAKEKGKRYNGRY
jgi:hypothetical protein